MAKKFSRKLNNSGSSLVTVIVIVAFLTILATTLLYLSGMNYQMKMTDRKTKENFYAAETGLEELRTNLAVMGMECSAECVGEVMNNYANVDGAARILLYRNFFAQKMAAKLEAKAKAANLSDPTTPDYELALKAMVGNNYKDAISLSPTVVNAGHFEIGENGLLYLRGVEYKYTDSKGYTTCISTDFIIAPPEYNFDLSASATAGPADGSAIVIGSSDVQVSETVVYTNWRKK